MLQISPKKGNAVLFYDVMADGQKTGEKDVMSLHGACDPMTHAYRDNIEIHSYNKVDTRAAHAHLSGLRSGGL